MHGAACEPRAPPVRGVAAGCAVSDRKLRAPTANPTLMFLRPFMWLAAVACGAEAGSGQQATGDEGIHQRQGEGHRQFLPAPPGHLLDGRKSAAGREGHTGRVHRDVPRHGNMPEIRQRGAEDHGQDDEGGRLKGGRGTAAQLTRRGGPGEKDQEGHMKPEVGAGNPAVIEEPHHGPNIGQIS